MQIGGASTLQKTATQGDGQQFQTHDLVVLSGHPLFHEAMWRLHVAELYSLSFPDEPQKHLQGLQRWRSERTLEPQRLFAQAAQQHRSTSAMEVCSLASTVVADANSHVAPDNHMKAQSTAADTVHSAS